jgi:tetratricopeptide (TPR) repeat protein
MVTTLMKYNPAFLGDEALIRSFVARTSELERILEVLRENTSGSNQHLLVIGPRGIGKTTLVLRTAAEIRADESLGARWYPVVYGEETYQVSSAGEFWLEALFHIGQQTGDARWQQAYEELLGERNEERLRPRALAQLMDFADEQGKRLVLVVENLNMLFGGQIGDQDAWVLRHTLMNEPRIMLVGTATSRFREMDEYNQALYELFRIIELEPLEDEEAQAVWTAASGQTAPRHQLRPIQILTGGNPRLIRILSEFAAKTSFRSLMEDLTRLVDEHTEYFKHHLDNLPAQERKVFVVLADLWDPSTARQVAEAARLDVNVASAQLKRLIERGAVTTPYKHGRAQFYQVAERMYNIYHLMRRRGQPSSRVHAVVRFMVSLYRDEELIRTTRSLAEEAALLAADQRKEHFHAYEAILAHTREPQVAKQLVETGRLLFQGMPDAPESLLRLLASEAAPVPGHPRTPEQAESEDFVSLAPDSPERAIAIEAALRRVLETDPNNEAAWHQLGLVLAEHMGRLEEAMEAFDRSIALDETDPSAWNNKGTALRELGRAEESLHAYERAVLLDAANRVAWAGKAAVLADLGRTAESLDALDHVISLDPLIDWAWAATGVALHQLGHPERALEALDRALALNAELADAWHNRGSVLGSLGRNLEALESYERALSLNSEEAVTWHDKGTMLLELGRAEEALEALDRCLSLDAHASATWINKAAALGHLGRYEEALETYDRAIALDANSTVAWTGRGGALAQVGRIEEALDAVERALALDEHNADAWSNMGALNGSMGRFEEALESFDRALTLNSGSASAWLNRSIALLGLGRMKEATASFEQALALSPDVHIIGTGVPSVALNAMAWAVFIEGRDEKRATAETWARTAVERAPESGRIRHTLACILGAQGKWEQALDEAAVFLRDAAVLNRSG